MKENIQAFSKFLWELDTNAHNTKQLYVIERRNARSENVKISDRLMTGSVQNTKEANKMNFMNITYCIF